MVKGHQNKPYGERPIRVLSWQAFHEQYEASNLFTPDKLQEAHDAYFAEVPHAPLYVSDTPDEPTKIIQCKAYDGDKHPITADVIRSRMLGGGDCHVSDEITFKVYDYFVHTPTVHACLKDKENILPDEVMYGLNSTGDTYNLLSICIGQYPDISDDHAWAISTPKFVTDKISFGYIEKLSNIPFLRYISTTAAVLYGRPIEECAIQTISQMYHTGVHTGLALKTSPDENLRMKKSYANIYHKLMRDKPLKGSYKSSSYIDVVKDLYASTKRQSCPRTGAKEIYRHVSLLTHGATRMNSDKILQTLIVQSPLATDSFQIVENDIKGFRLPLMLETTYITWHGIHVVLIFSTEKNFCKDGVMLVDADALANKSAYQHLQIGELALLLGNYMKDYTNIKTQKGLTTVTRVAKHSELKQDLMASLHKTNRFFSYIVPGGQISECTNPVSVMYTKEYANALIANCVMELDIVVRLPPHIYMSRTIASHFLNFQAKTPWYISEYRNCRIPIIGGKQFELISDAHNNRITIDGGCAPTLESCIDIQLYDNGERIYTHVVMAHGGSARYYRNKILAITPRISTIRNGTLMAACAYFTMYYFQIMKFIVERYAGHTLEYSKPGSI